MNVAVKPLAPGVYDMDRATYDQDPCMEPSLSSSIAKIILTRSPAHARLAHPRLNPAFERSDDRKFDLGSLAHAVLLGERDRIVSIDADSYRTNAAKEARDEALAAGLVPALAHVVDQAEKMAAAARRQLDASDHGEAFTDGKPEQTMIWQDGGVWCRSRLDWLPNEPGPRWYDYKTTAASANPLEWWRTMYNTGGDVQEAFYRRGIQATFGLPFVELLFVVQEAEPPYALSVCALSGEAQALADDKVARALGTWGWCLKNDRWPGYPRDTAYLFPPRWEQNREEDVAVLTQGKPAKDMVQKMIEWMAP